MNSIMNNNSTLQLNQLESFNFAFKYLWSPDAYRRAKLHIVDTIVLKDGLPYYWIFSSDKTGEILKKKAERLKSIPDILKYLKTRNRVLKGYKSGVLKSKIATVWYFEVNQKLSCILVDEGELQVITSTKMNDIFCIQSFMGGYPLKGNGVFEHRMWTQKDGGVKHLTYEGITADDSSDNISGQKSNIFASQTSGKLNITENHHSILTSLCNYLIRHFSLTANLKVSDMTFLAVFSASHVPYIVYFRKIGIAEPSSAYLDERQRVELIYIAGETPFEVDQQLCEPTTTNIPVSNTTTVTDIDQTKKSLQVDMNKYPNYTAEYSKKPLERLTKQEILAKQEVDVTLINEIITTSNPRSSNTHSVQRRPISSSGVRNNAKIKAPEVKSHQYESAEDVKLRVEMESTVPNFGKKAATYYSKTDSFGIPNDYTKTSISATLHPYPGSSSNNENRQSSNAKMTELFNTTKTLMKGKKLFDGGGGETGNRQRDSYDQVYRPVSASSVTMLRQTITQNSLQYHGGFSPSKNNDNKIQSDGSPKRRLQVDLADINQEFIVRPHETITEASKLGSTFYKRLKDITDGNSKQKEDIFANRRPISAPHPNESANIQKYFTELDDEDNNKPEVNSEESGSTKKDKNKKEFGVHKALSLSGNTCFGLYCNFDQRAKNAAMGEAQAVQVQLSKSEKCKECPHRIAYKSLLLAKAETKFLGADMDENIESFVDQMKLNSSSVELLYTFFIKKHLNRVANKCLLEAEKAVTSNESNVILKENLNAIYRRLIYHDALEQVHPSRFYLTVPICQMCYNIYTFMDTQRDKIVFLTSSAVSDTHHRDHKKIETKKLNKNKTRPSSAPSIITGAKILKNKPVVNEFEDIYIEDSMLNTDDFIPKHTAQRDIIKDTNLSQTAHVRQLAAKFYDKRLHIEGDGISEHQQEMTQVVAPAAEKPGPPRITVVNGKSRITLRPGQFQKHFQNRKKGLAITMTSRVPINSLNGGLYDETGFGNYGIGSRGPTHPNMANPLPSNPNAKAISGWVKLIGKTDETSISQEQHPNADYVRKHGLRTALEWDHQGAPPHVRPTSSSSLRIKVNPSEAKPSRPHSAQPYIRPARRSVSPSSVSGKMKGKEKKNHITANAAAAIELERCKSQVKFAISDSSGSNSEFYHDSNNLDLTQEKNLQSVTTAKAADIKHANYKTRFDSLYDTILYDKIATKTEEFSYSQMQQQQQQLPIQSLSSSYQGTGTTFLNRSFGSNESSWVAGEEDTTLLTQKISNLNDQILAFGSNNSAYAYSYLPFMDAPQFNLAGQIIHPVTANHNTVIPSTLLQPIISTVPTTQPFFESYSSSDSKILYKTSQEIQNHHQQQQQLANISQYQVDSNNSQTNHYSDTAGITNANIHISGPPIMNESLRVSMEDPPMSPPIYKNTEYQAPAYPLPHTTIQTNKVDNNNNNDDDDDDDLFEKDEFFDLLEDEMSSSKVLVENSSMLPMNLSQNLEDHNHNISSHHQLPSTMLSQQHHQVVAASSFDDYPSLFIPQDSPSSITPMNLSQTLSPFHLPGSNSQNFYSPVHN